MMIEPKKKYSQPYRFPSVFHAALDLYNNIKDVEVIEKVCIFTFEIFEIA